MKFTWSDYAVTMDDIDRCRFLTPGREHRGERGGGKTGHPNFLPVMIKCFVVLA